MKRTVQIISAVIFLATTTCSLVLSASSTLAKAHAVHVPPGALWSAVGVLELVSLAATMRWLTAETFRGQVEAWVVSGLVLLVTSVAGVAVYGWFGVVAPSAVVACVYLLHSTLSDVMAAEKAEAANAPTKVFEAQTPLTPDQSATELLPAASPPPAPTSAGDRVLREIHELQDLDMGLVGMAMSLLNGDPKMGRPRLLAALKIEYPDTTDNTAKRLLRVLRPVKSVDGAA